MLARSGEDEASVLSRIKAEAAAKLPAYMLPRSYTFLASFPTTTSGKLDKKRLPPPFTTATTGAADAVGAALQAVLGRSDLAASDTIFMHGATSIDFVRIVAHLRETTGRAIRIADAFAAASSDGLRRLVAEAPVGTARDAWIDADPLAVSPAQRQMWLAQEMADDARAYLLFVEVETKRAPPELASAVRAVIVRHPPLHSAIDLDPDRFRRVRIATEEEPVRLGEGADGWDAVIEAHLASPWPFTALISERAGGAVARIVADHAVFDRWSLEILREELASLLVDRAPPPLPRCVCRCGTSGTMPPSSSGSRPISRRRERSPGRGPPMAGRRASSAGACRSRLSTRCVRPRANSA